MISRPARRARAASTVAWRIKLLPARQKSCPVHQRPAVVLNMGDLEPVGAERHGEIDNVFEMFEVLPMNNCVDGQRQPCLANQLRYSMLDSLRAGKPRDPVSGSGTRILQAS